MTTNAAALYLGVPSHYLAQLRVKRKGPKYKKVKIDHRIHCIYAVEDLDEWKKQMPKGKSKCV